MGSRLVHRDFPILMEGKTTRTEWISGTCLKRRCFGKDLCHLWGDFPKVFQCVQPSYTGYKHDNAILEIWARGFFVMDGHFQDRENHTNHYR